MSEDIKMMATMAKDMGMSDSDIFCAFSIGVAALAKSKSLGAKYPHERPDEMDFSHIEKDGLFFTDMEEVADRVRASGLCSGDDDDVFTKS